ncbi:hypothetical protein KUTeg_007187 [Tegillarca granosa]|uniref:Receptor ligand binding region domain-containing protein n=1 Tax=Tegillarca granosa TaxID=220873 RepID=A0ABQ9FCJ2_TEGGR|nr:hypothetical protein KUTeg_007187 [Tegillarca granosa]
MIKDYSRDYNLGTSWPINEAAVCKPGTKCTSCISENLAKEVFYQDGDVIVVGIIPAYSQDTSNPMGCGAIRTSFGMQLAEALIYTVTMFNENYGQFSHYFQDKKIGYLIINSCNQALIVQNKIMNMYENGIVLRNGTRVNVNDKIVGFIGGYGSDISVAMANVLTKLNHVQISYASTAAVLSDRTLFPYFLRVATPDDEQSKLLLKLVTEQRSNYIQIVYSSETYGMGGRNYLRQYANLKQFRNAQNEYLHAITGDIDHYSQVGDENEWHRPSLPSRRMEAQAAVVYRPKSKELAVLRNDNSYITPDVINPGFTDGIETGPDSQADNNYNLAKTDTNETDNHERKRMPKIPAESI